MLIYEFEDLLVTPRLLAKRYWWKQGRRQDGGWDPPEKWMRRSDLHWVSILSTIGYVGHPARAVRSAIGLVPALLIEVARRTANANDRRTSILVIMLSRVN